MKNYLTSLAIVGSLSLVACDDRDERVLVEPPVPTPVGETTMAPTIDTTMEPTTAPMVDPTPVMTPTPGMTPADATIESTTTTTTLETESTNSLTPPTSEPALPESDPNENM